MPLTIFRNRRAVSIENEHLRVTVLQEGGHIAEIFDKETGVSPLWIPPWPSIEPSTYSLAKNPEYGADDESKLLSGIMGHNLCLDIFGGPSTDEAAAGFGVHGEAPIASYDIEVNNATLRMRAEFPMAAIKFERLVELQGRNIRFVSTVESLASIDRPIGWTEHVTLGPPFVHRGDTEIRSSATRSKVFETDFGAASYLQPGAEFIWPMAPRKDGAHVDLRVFTNAEVSGAFTTHLMDVDRKVAFFAVFSPAHNLMLAYVWKREDFPWMGIWEENRSRMLPPWNGRTTTWALEFGVSPFPETRRKMIDRHELFGVPGYRWLPAKARITAEFWVITRNIDSIPESISWPGSP